MLIKIAEATDLQIDFLVATCEGYKHTTDGINFLVEKENKLIILGQNKSRGIQFGFSPSTDWGQGGKIIDRMMEQGFTLSRGGTDAGNTRCWAKLENHPGLFSGPTPLIAAMRCFLASRLGKEIEVPNNVK